MGRDITVTSTLIKDLERYIWIFCTLWGLFILYAASSGDTFGGYGVSFSTEAPGMLLTVGADGNSVSIWTVLTSGDPMGIFKYLLVIVLDSALELASWFSPFIIVKALLLFIIGLTGDPMVYNVINLFIIRPLAFVSTIYLLDTMKEFIGKVLSAAGGLIGGLI